MKSSIYAVLSPKNSSLITHSFGIYSKHNIEKEVIEFVYHSMSKKYYSGEIISCFLFDGEIKDNWQRMGIAQLELQIPKTNKYKSAVYDLYLLKSFYWNNGIKININGILQFVPHVGYFANPRSRIHMDEFRVQPIVAQKVSLSLIKSGNKLIDKDIQVVNRGKRKEYAWGIL